jgi:hypothetical protein
MLRLAGRGLNLRLGDALHPLLATPLRRKLSADPEMSSTKMIINYGLELFAPAVHNLARIRSVFFSAN